MGVAVFLGTTKRQLGAFAFLVCSVFEPLTACGSGVFLPQDCMEGLVCACGGMLGLHKISQESNESSD